jgi:hypothetical protein
MVVATADTRIFSNENERAAGCGPFSFSRTAMDPASARERELRAALVRRKLKRQDFVETIEGGETLCYVFVVRRAFTQVRR